MFFSAVLNQKCVKMHRDPKNFKTQHLSFGTVQLWELVPYSKFAFPTSQSELLSSTFSEKRLSPSMFSSTRLTNFPLFSNKGLGILSFSPLCICTSVSLQSSTGLHKLPLHDLKNDAFVSPAPESHWTLPDLPRPMSQSENTLIRKHIHLTTVGKIYGFLGVSAGTHYVEGGKTEWVLLYQERQKNGMLNFP